MKDTIRYLAVRWKSIPAGFAAFILAACLLTRMFGSDSFFAVYAAMLPIWPLFFNLILGGSLDAAAQTVISMGCTRRNLFGAYIALLALFSAFELAAVAAGTLLLRGVTDAEGYALLRTLSLPEYGALYAAGFCSGIYGGWTFLQAAPKSYVPRLMLFSFVFLLLAVGCCVLIGFGAEMRAAAALTAAAVFAALAVLLVWALRRKLLHYSVR